MNPALIIAAVKKVAKHKAIKQVSNLLLKKKTDKLDMVLSYIGGDAGSAIRWFKTYADKCKKWNDSIARNKHQLSLLAQGIRKGDVSKGGAAKWSVKKATQNIQTALKHKRDFVSTSIKKAVFKKISSVVPGKRLVMSVKDLAQAIYKKEDWRKISKRFGALMSNMGLKEISHYGNLVNKYGSLALSANTFWKKISTNHSAEHPIIGTSGGMKLKYARQYKDKFQDAIFDREFFFFVNSPYTGNFDQNIHSYDPVLKEYNLPIRGWGGTEVRYYHYYGHSMITLDRVISLCCNLSTDFGRSFYADIRSKVDGEQRYWLLQDPHYATQLTTEYIQQLETNYFDKNK